MNKSPRNGFRPAGTGEPAGPGEESKPSPPILLGLLNRASLISFLFCFLCLLLYALGFWREFTRPSLLALIQMAVYGGIALAILSLYRFGAGLWFSLRRRRPLFLLRSLGFLFLGAFGGLVAAMGTFIAALAEGNIK